MKFGLIILKDFCTGHLDRSGVDLEHTYTYGVRRYTNGSWLAAHVDRLVCMHWIYMVQYMV